MASEDVGSRADFAPCKIRIHANPWRSIATVKSPMDGFTVFLDRHTPHPKIGETAQTGNCCYDGYSKRQSRNRLQIDVVAAVFFDTIKGSVGGLDQGLGRTFVKRSRGCDTDADRDEPGSLGA